MKIDRTNNVSFGIHIDTKFMENAENYYLKRGYNYQHRALKNTAEKLDLYSTPKSQIVYRVKEMGNNRHEYMLCFKNEDLNNKKAFVLVKTNSFTEVLKYFTGITTKMIDLLENALPKIKD